jgi:hypothetical protein
VPSKNLKTSRGPYKGQDMSILVNIFEIYLVRKTVPLKDVTTWGMGLPALPTGQNSPPLANTATTHTNAHKEV